MQLAQRRAIYAARRQFVEALKIVAYRLDAQSHVAQHGTALKSGLTALEEADDFLSSRSEILTSADLAGFIAGHRTPVLKVEASRNVTPVEALQRYHAYAVNQLKRAGGNDTVASGSLYGLGRVEALHAASDPGRALLFEQKAISLYQAALLIDSKNSLAGNELGVMLYRNGRVDEALWCLLRSMAASPQPETAHNLEVVYGVVGDVEGADWARMMHETLIAVVPDSSTIEASLGSGASLSLRMVDPETFQEASPPEFLQEIPRGPALSGAVPPAEAVK